MTICIICKKYYNHYPFFNRISNDYFICSNCFASFPIVHKKIKIDNIDIYCIYGYRPPINSYLMNLKMKGDIAFSKVFLTPFKTYLNFIYKGYIILPVPSSNKSDRKRGFNHVQEIAKTLSLPIKSLFYKDKEYKQTSQHFLERSKVHKIIKLKGHVDKNKKYLIIDDVITSGNTIKACINLLKSHGVKSIKVLVISYNYHK